MSGLTAATASTDPDGSTVGHLLTGERGINFCQYSVTISGTATDAGGVLVGVEISVDGGTTRQQVNGSSSWTYSWTPTLAGTATIQSSWLG